MVEYSTANCLAENAAMLRGEDTAPLMDGGKAQEFWQYLRTTA